MIKKHRCTIFLPLIFFVSFLFFPPAFAKATVSANAANACLAAHDKTLRQHLFENTDYNQKLAQELVINGVKVISDGRLLNAYTNSSEPDDVVSVKQMDYGVVTGLFLDGSGNIIAIGDQTSYRVKITTSSGKAKFHELEELPRLWRDQCGISGVLFGSCPVSDVSFSKEIRAAFVSGFDTWGVKRSYAFGLGATAIKELTLPEGAAPVYLVDVPDSGQALFKDFNNNTFYAFDGERFQSCNN